MKRHSFWQALPIISAAILALALPATATPQQDAIAARKAGFKKMGAAMKTLNQQIKSGTIDKASAVAAAQTINATAKQQGALFPAGSGRGAGVKTDALPAIWSDRATFDNRMNSASRRVGETRGSGELGRRRGGWCAVESDRRSLRRVPQAVPGR